MHCIMKAAGLYMYVSVFGLIFAAGLCMNVFV